VSVETEAKLRVESHEPVRGRLRELGAVLIGRVREFNRILDRPDGSLRKQGRGLRLRTAVSETRGHGPERPSAATLTFKGRVQPGPMKSREELEVEISDADVFAQLLERLGFTTVLFYEKRRESWRLGPCRIELDEPPHIGLFVEIEGPDVDAIRDVQTSLGLDHIPQEPASYVRMLLAYCERHGITDRVLR